MRDNRVGQPDLAKLTTPGAESRLNAGEPVVFSRSVENFWGVSEDVPDLNKHLSRLDRLSRSWWGRQESESLNHCPRMPSTKKNLISLSICYLFITRKALAA